MSVPFDSIHFRHVLGHVPTCVVVVTGCSSDGTPAGVTIGSFASVSLEPPMVGFFQGVNSRSWPLIEQSGFFCVNVLALSQEELCWRFAKEYVDGDPSRFEDIDYTLSPSGAPVLPGVIAWIDCSIESVTPAGDHWFVLARVNDLHTTESKESALVFFKGRTSGVTAH
ncbi:MAG: flavin reductase family protein [Actinomycetota bacterium]